MIPFGGLFEALGARRRDRTRRHYRDPERSAEWNAWRERQAVAPQPIYEAGLRISRRPKQTRAARNAQRASRQGSTRAARARRDREEKLAEAGVQVAHQS